MESFFDLKFFHYPLQLFSLDKKAYTKHSKECKTRFESEKLSTAFNLRSFLYLSDWLMSKTLLLVFHIFNKQSYSSDGF